MSGDLVSRDPWLRLDARPTAVPLPSPLRNHRGSHGDGRSWLLRLEADDGRVGWGEAVIADRVLDPGAADGIAAALVTLGPQPRRHDLEAQLPQLPRPLAFGLGLALAELDGLGRDGWRGAPRQAQLLPAGAGAPLALERLLAHGSRAGTTAPPLPLTVKWKVAVADPDQIGRAHV